MSAVDKQVREYATEEIVVEWDARLCYHSHNCIRALPQVFDPDRRPWVMVDAATADEVEAAVARCPSGALRARRVGSEPAKREQPLELRASANGPLLVSGGVRIVAADGTVLYEASGPPCVAAVVRATSPSATGRTRPSVSRADPWSRCTRRSGVRSQRRCARC